MDWTTPLWIIAKAGAAAAAVAAMGLAALFLYQTDLVYPAKFPPNSRKVVATPDQVGFDEWEDVEITTSDGVRIRAFYLPHRTPEATRKASGKLEGDSELRERVLTTASADQTPTILYFHANAGNCGHRLGIARRLQDEVPCNILLLSYRGYGLSEGSPSERGLQRDADAALDWLERRNVKSVVLFGQSIGGAVAIDLASRRPEAVAALVIENTFLSIPKLIPHLMPILAPFSVLCTEKWPSEARIRKIGERTPVLFLASARDQMIPPAHMRTLCALVRQERGYHASLKPADWEKLLSTSPKESVGNTRFVEFPEADHNNACMEPTFFDEIAKFIATAVRG